ncbi:MAG: SGNH/GDSL hydrolase family protein [Methylocystis sp.]
MYREALRVGLALAVSSGMLFYGVKRSDAPTLDCVTVNDGADDYKLLVVGESWACDGKLFPELPKTISERLGGRGVHACSVCFPGRNSRHLYSELSEKLPNRKLYEMSGGKPDKVIFMNGVNDEIQHVGPNTYVEYTRKLVDYFSDVEDEEVITIPRVDEIGFRSPYLYSRIKRGILRCYYDDCEYSANERYRAALWRDHPDLRMIEFDNFIDRYRGNEQCYTSDRVHLTDECSHKYGAFIGRAASIKTRAPNLSPAAAQR